MLTTVLITALAAAPEVAFAFSDATGQRVLAVGSVAAPKLLTRLVCGGTLLGARYSNTQERGREDNGRETYHNFDNRPGPVFAVEGGTARVGSTCLLGSAGFFANRTVHEVNQASKGDCDAKTSEAISHAQKRKVKRCALLGNAALTSFVVVEFEPSGQERLLGLAVVSGNRVSQQSYSAKATADGTSCWRVDDGCNFSPEAFRIPFILTGDRGTELFVLWDGPEGQSAELLKVNGGVLEPEASASRYWSPL